MYSITKSKTTKRYAIFIGLVYIFVFKDWMEQYIPVVGYMDELFAVLSIPVFVFELKKNVSTHLTTLGIFQASSRGILVH